MANVIRRDPRFTDALLHHYTNLGDIARATQAAVSGQQAAFRPWPGMPGTNLVPTVNNYYPPPDPAAPPETPTPAKPNLLASLGKWAAGGTLAGALLAGGAAGSYYLLKDSIAGAFKAKVTFTPEKGIEVGPLEPAK